MEMTRAHVVELIQKTLEVLNAERAAGEQIEVNEDTPLLGGDSQLDSLAFVAFIADLEDRLQASADREYVLVGELDSAENHPFRSVATLAEHIVGMSAGAD